MEQGRSQSLRLSTKSPKLIPKDISESLGKLPPQALDLEEAILGSVILEQKAIERVVSFLLPDHFYSEQHKEIYKAVMDLHSDGIEIDFRSVIARLRKTGKLELVGGHLYIVELTNKVSTAGNLEHNSRIVIEMAIKREMIQIASVIHHTAYEDTADAHELVDKALKDLQDFAASSVSKNEKAWIEQMWASTLVTTAPPDAPPLITIDGTPICTPNNHSLIIGKKKSRKSLFMVWLVAEYLKQYPDNAQRILLFDTEQGQKHVYAMRQKIYKMTGLYIPIFYLRGMSPKERQQFILQTIVHWKTKPLWVIIDGIRDLMSNINDPDESTELIVWLEKITLHYNVHVSDVLHINKTDGNARGHIGSELLNKAETTIELELDEKNNCSNIKCESSRDKPFATFSFTHDAEGLPMIVGTPMGGTVIKYDDKKIRLEAIFEDGPLGYKHLVEDIKAHFGVGMNKAKALLAEFCRVGWIVRSGNARASDTVYKLMTTSANGHHYGEQLVIKPAVNHPEPVENNVNTDDLPF